MLRRLSVLIPLTPESTRKSSSQLLAADGSYVEFAGNAEAQAQSRRDLLVVTGNPHNLLLVLANLPSRWWEDEVRERF